jgi:hypothetical protein
VQVWGAQLEAGSFATSYIPTVASQVTRAADNASIIGNNFAEWYNQNAGTVYTQASTFAVSSGVTKTVVEFNDTTVNERIQLNTNVNSPSGLNLLVVDNNVSQVNITTGLTTNFAVFELAAAFEADNFGFSVNGGSAATDLSGTIPTVTKLDIGVRYSADRYLNGTISRIAYYPRRLADSELQGITS